MKLYKNIERLLAISYFNKKAPLQLFHRVLSKDVIIEKVTLVTDVALFVIVYHSLSTKMVKHTQTIRRLLADKLFECV